MIARVMLPLVVLVFAACPDAPPVVDGDVSSGDAAEDVASGPQVPADWPQPALYTEVAGYGTRCDAAENALIPVFDAFRAGDLSAVQDSFSTALAAELPTSAVQTLFDGVDAEGGLGPLTSIRCIAVDTGVWFWSTHDTDAALYRLGGTYDGEQGVTAFTLEVLPEDAPGPNADFTASVEFALPLKGLTYVLWGGAGPLLNRHWASPAEAWAYDLVVWEGEGVCAAPCGANEDHHVFGRTVYAPAGGTVVRVDSGHPDQPLGVSDAAVPYGNSVVIEVASGVFLRLAQLREGSISVSEGDVVMQGQAIAEVGNSGDSEAPHLHVGLADAPATATALPLQFSDLVINGVDLNVALPIAGTFVRQQVPGD